MFYYKIKHYIMSSFFHTAHITYFHLWSLCVCLYTTPKQYVSLYGETYNSQYYIIQISLQSNHIHNMSNITSLITITKTINSNYNLIFKHYSSINNILQLNWINPVHFYKYGISNIIKFSELYFDYGLRTVDTF